MKSEILDIIKNEMQQQNMNRAEMARRIGTSWGFVDNILKHDTNTTLETLFKMAGALDIQFKFVRVGVQNAKD